MVHVPSKCTQPIKMHPHQSTPLPLPQIFFSLYPLNQSFNFLLPTNTPILLIISYPMIYISSKTSDNSMSNCLFYALSCFAYNTPMTTAINMFLPLFKSSYRPLSNYMCPVQMRPAVQNATRIQCWIQGIKYSAFGTCGGNCKVDIYMLIYLYLFLFTQFLLESKYTQLQHSSRVKTRTL